MNSTELTWRDRHGAYHKLSDMETPYLYHVVKCIWNNVVGRHHPFGDVIQWGFDPQSYPADHLRQVFTKGLSELISRGDITDTMRDFAGHTIRGLAPRH